MSLTKMKKKKVEKRGPGRIALPPGERRIWVRVFIKESTLQRFGPAAVDNFRIEVQEKVIDPKENGGNP